MSELQAINPGPARLPLAAHQFVKLEVVLTDGFRCARCEQPIAAGATCGEHTRHDLGPYDKSWWFCLPCSLIVLLEREGTVCDDETAAKIRAGDPLNLPPPGEG